MVLEADDQQRVDDAIAEAASKGSTKLLVRDPDESQKLGPLTVICTILNRTIGSGIYVTPAIVLKATGSVGVSLLLWTLGAVIGMSALFVWLELGLSIPKYELPVRESTEGGEEGATVLQSVPRNGGEKNYLEYIYKLPKLRTTCMYGVMFVILGNLSGNAIAFGTYVLQAANIEHKDAAARGLAVACLTVACLLHGVWRRGGIWVNNGLAALKVLILVAVIGIGFAASAGAKFGHGPVHGETVDPITGKVTPNFDTKSSFAHPHHDAASYADSILFIVHTYSGYEQPFYVLSEVSRPRKIFAKSTIAAMVLVCILFILVNVAYLCAVSFNQQPGSQFEITHDMATLFFSEVFNNDTAPRVMSGIIALAILGNIIVMTFTASRVKQEIAKEGVLPFSLFFATSTTTPYAYLKAKLFPSHIHPSEQYHPEQSPAAALLLHWVFSMILIGATSGNTPSVAYTILVSLYSYAVVIIVGFFVTTGLLYLRLIHPDRAFWKKNAGFNFLGPTAPIIYSLTCAFLIVAAFLPPSASSPFHKSKTQPEWYIVPTVGLAVYLLGYVYYLVFAYVIPKLRKQVLVVEREAVIVKEKGEWVQAIELVYADWGPRSGPVAADGNGYANGDGYANGNGYGNGNEMRHSEVQRLTVHTE